MPDEPEPDAFLGGSPPSPRVRAGQRPHFVYARDGNPTVRSLEVQLAALEGAEDAVACASGMAAIGATLLHLLGDGGHLVASDDIYAVARDLLCDDLPRAGARRKALVAHPRHQRAC